MLTLKDAKQIAEKIMDFAESEKLNPLAVAVLDKGGHSLCTLRHHEAGILRNDIAFGKAWGALGMGFGTRTFASMVSSSDKFQSFVGALSDMSNGKVVPTQGGVLIRNSDGELIGAVGVSGDSSENDEAAILNTLESLNYIAQP